MNNKPYTQSEYISKVDSINPNIEVLGEYTFSHAKILARCKICGTKWSPTACRLLQGNGCPECGKRIAVENRKGKTAKKTTNQFIQELRTINSNITIVGEYTGNRNKIDCSCDVCGYQWSAVPYSLLNGSGCPNCSKLRRKNYRRYTPDSFKEKVYQVNPNIQLISEFTKSTEPIEVKCKQCGNIWSPKAFTLLQGRGCAKCGRQNGIHNNHGRTGLKSKGVFIEELAKVDDSIEIIGEYINNHSNIKCKCNRCEHVWAAKPYSLLQGHGCPRCAKSGTSFMEQLILLCFREVLGNEAVLSRNRSLINMELDIFIPELNMAIEPGNWFLHKRSLKRDEQKRLRCKEKGVRLITVYDKYPKDTAPPFPDNCYIYSDDLNISDHSIIHKLIYDLFTECGISTRFSNTEWNNLEDLAYKNSKALTHEDFVARLFAIRPDIEVIGKYENANRRISVKCRNCGYSWNGVPANLLQGDGCRKCGAKTRGDKARKKQEDFEKELKDYIPTIMVIGEYISRHEKIAVKCLKCGTVWNTTPGSLLRKEYQNNPNNNGCPTCAKSRQGTPRKKVINLDTGEIFESAVAAGEKYNIVPAAIRHCCTGQSRSSGGYVWKYIDEKKSETEQATSD